MFDTKTAKGSGITSIGYQATKSRLSAVLPLHKKAQDIGRRDLISVVSLALPLLWPSEAGASEVHRATAAGISTAAERPCSELHQLPNSICYAQAGPLQPLELPRLTHTCTSCFPSCVGDRCILNISVTYPKGGSVYGLYPPYPLAVFSGGFTVNSAAYKSTAARLASWGYTVIRYDTRDALPDVLDDITCVRLQRELIDWAATHPLMRRLADTSRVYLTGHSRGGKLAALTAAADSRVAALCLLDPVDVTQYAPLSDRFPSAAAALRQVVQTGRFLPVAVVGSGQSGPSAAWEVFLPDAGHFQYLDQSSVLQRAVCGGGAGTAPDDSAVRLVSQAVMVAWGEAMVKPYGTDVISSIAEGCAGPGRPTGTTAHIISRSNWPWYTQRGAADALQARASTIMADSSSAVPGSMSHAVAVPSFAISREQVPSAHGPAHAGPETVTGMFTNHGQGVLDTVSNSSGSQANDIAQQPSSGLANSNFQVIGNTADAQATQQAADLMKGPLPLEQTRQEVWSVSKAPSPAQLISRRADLQQLLVGLSYQSAATLNIETRFRNFGS